MKTYFVSYATKDNIYEMGHFTAYEIGQLEAEGNEIIYIEED